MTKIITLDQTVFRWVNGHHSDWLDWTMWCFSQGWSWLIVILTAYIFITLRNDRKGWLWVLAGIGLCFLLADQISTNAIKEGVQRLRPCHELEGVRMFHTGKGGLYGFVSSVKRKAESGERRTENGERGAENGKFRSTVLPYLMFGWAMITGYSRVYLGKHYPGDVICGALLGIGVGAAVYFAISRIRRRAASKSVA